MDQKELNISFPKEGLRIKATDLAIRNITGDSAIIQKVAAVCKWWYETDLPMSVSSSGSTGIPKKFSFQRTAVKTSIQMTTEALGLKHGMNALLAIDPHYIGGRMMILRALENGMNLICTAPEGNPLEASGDTDNFDFAAFVPIQIESILSNSETTEKFSRIGRILIGGAPVSEKLKERLSGFPNRIYQTFGMTETLSHIAFKNLADRESSYVPLPGVIISADNRGCLVVEVPGLLETRLVTNDLITQESENEFRWIGRIDRRINSGGIKISPELLEAKCESLLCRYTDPTGYFFHWQADDRLGQKVVLVVTAESDLSSEVIKALTEGLKVVLEKYEMPKAILQATKTCLTPGGKPDHQATLDSAHQIWP
jgi:O-succinylbenzoic acid--CoA ligase